MASDSTDQQRRTIFVDDRRYEFNGHFITGASIAALANSSDRVIYLDEHADTPDYSDWQVYPSNGMRTFELFGGERFYTHPRASYVS